APPPACSPRPTATRRRLTRRSTPRGRLPTRAAEPRIARLCQTGLKSEQLANACARPVASFGITIFLERSSVNQERATVQLTPVVGQLLRLVQPSSSKELTSIKKGQPGQNPACPEPRSGKMAIQDGQPRWPTKMANQDGQCVGDHLAMLECRAPPSRLAPDGRIFISEKVPAKSLLIYYGMSGHASHAKRSPNTAATSNTAATFAKVIVAHQPPRGTSTDPRNRAPSIGVRLRNSALPLAFPCPIPSRKSDLP